MTRTFSFQPFDLREKTSENGEHHPAAAAIDGRKSNCP
jgi:hypothetical protein